MADSGTGIQELMAAETRASQIVAEARIGRYCSNRPLESPRVRAILALIFAKTRIHDDPALLHTVIVYNSQAAVIA